MSLIFPVSIWKKPGAKNRKKEKKQERVLRSGRDDVELMLTVYHYTFPKLTKEFACKQHWCWFEDEDTSSSEQCVCKDFLFKTPTLALHIREGGIPVFPPAQDQNHVFHCNEPPPSQPGIQLQSKRKRRKEKIMTNSIVSHSVDCNQGWHLFCSLNM